MLNYQRVPSEISQMTCKRPSFRQVCRRQGAEGSMDLSGQDRQVDRRHAFGGGGQGVGGNV
jgi:hypothetical protein